MANSVPVHALPYLYASLGLRESMNRQIYRAAGCDRGTAVGPPADSPIDLGVDRECTTDLGLDSNSGSVYGAFTVGVSQDAPGLVKPVLAQWTFDPSQGWPWQTLDSWQSGSLTYPSGAQLSSAGFQPATNGFAGPWITQVRVPRQGRLWMGNYQQSMDEDGNPVTDENGNPIFYPGPYAYQDYALPTGTARPACPNVASVPEHVLP